MTDGPDDGTAVSIYELARVGFGAAAALFAPVAFDRAQVFAALEGGDDARLFVDDPALPTAALLCRTYGYYLAGAAVPGLRRFVADAPAEAGVFADLYGYVPFGGAWERALRDDYGDRLVAIPRRGFAYAGTAGTAARLLAARPVGAEVRPIDAALADRLAAELDEEVGTFWGGRDRFLAGGFGAAAFVGGRPVSLAYAVAVGGGEANIGVATRPAHRRRGLATLASAAFVAESLRRALRPTWDCDAANTASAALALHLGFAEGAGAVQLSPPGYGKLELSEGRWGRESGRDAGVLNVWRRNAEANPARQVEPLGTAVTRVETLG